jgi:hypothetical protein
MSGKTRDATESESKKEYRYHPVSWGFFALLAASNIFALAYNIIFRGDSLLRLISHPGMDILFLILILFPVKVYRTSVRLGENAVHFQGLIRSKEVAYADIRQIDIAVSLDAVSIRTGQEVFWPAISVYYGMFEWPDLAKELVRRVPPKTKVHDSSGIAAEVEQSELFEESG